MKTIKKYLKIILGCFIIGATLSLFFLGNKIVPSGTFGFSILFNYRTSMNLSLVVLLINVFFIALGSITIDFKYIKKAFLPFLLIPLFISLTGPLKNLVDLSEVDTLLISIYGGVLIGIGYRLIYREEYLVSGADILLLIVREIVTTKRYLINYIVDFCWLIFACILFGFEGALYSLIVIAIIEILSRRANIGISDSKVFYIITKKEREIRKYIIEEMHYELTTFDVKGGFLQTRNKVIMSAIPTKDYYKLKEGVKSIDPHAFISITDSYEVIKNTN